VLGVRPLRYEQGADQVRRQIAEEQLHVANREALGAETPAEPDLMTSCARGSVHIRRSGVTFISAGSHGVWGPRQPVRCNQQERRPAAGSARAGDRRRSTARTPDIGGLTGGHQTLAAGVLSTLKQARLC
jgi:hypothetical protein